MGGRLWDSGVSETDAEAIGAGGFIGGAALSASAAAGLGLVANGSAPAEGWGDVTLAKPG